MGTSISPSVTHGLDTGVSNGLLAQMSEQNKNALTALGKANADLKEMHASDMNTLVQQGKAHDLAMSQKDEVFAKERMSMQAQMTSMQATSQHMMVSMMSSFMNSMPSIINQTPQLNWG